MNYIVTIFVVGCLVVAWNRSAARAGRPASVWRRIRAMGWGVLLLPVALLWFAVSGPTPWSIGLLVLVGAAAVLSPSLAADRVPLALLLLGMCAVVIAFAVLSRQASAVGGNIYVRPSSSPPKPSVVHLALRPSPGAGPWLGNLLILPEVGLILAFGLWLIPRTLGADIWTVKGLGRRVQRLAEARTDAVDGAAAELRRVERDLHDGAQARLVALGMNLRAAERLMPTSPEAALALVAEARETSSRALTDLRDLVRGIHPPVLADRGLADAVRALALDTPLRTSLDIDFPGRLDAPVESALYFSVAEVLANAVKHAGARAVEIRMQHRGGVLRIAVTDDGAGGADPAKGTGLRGIERRLGAFDGILVVNSPPGGPTMIIIEVPCGLS
jgi:signal transduction histidine kinase